MESSFRNSDWLARPLSNQHSSCESFRSLVRSHELEMFTSSTRSIRTYAPHCRTEDDANKREASVLPPFSASKPSVIIIRLSPYSCSFISSRPAIMYVSGVLFGYVVLVIVCAACAVAIGWSVHSLFYRDHFASPQPMRAPQQSYMRDVRQRERQQLMTSNDGTTQSDKKNFHDEFDESCTYIGS